MTDKIKDLYTEEERKILQENGIVSFEEIMDLPISIKADEERLGNWHE